MKKLQQMSWKFLLLGTLFFTACESGDDPAVDPVFNQQQLNNDVQGTWVITLFEERGIDETADFQGFTFEIDSTGTVVARRNDFELAGTWRIEFDDDGDCDEEDDDDIDFEHLVTSVNLENNTFTLGNGVVVQVNSSTDIDDEDYETLAEVKAALDAGVEVEADGDARVSDSTNIDLIALEVEFENVTGENENYDSNTGMTGGEQGDCSDDDWELHINFPTQEKPLEELNDDWDVISVSDTKIELMDVSGGDGHIERLTIMKQ